MATEVESKMFPHCAKGRLVVIIVVDHGLDVVIALDFLLGPLPLGDVLHRAQHLDGTSVRVKGHFPLFMDDALRAVGPPDAVVEAVGNPGLTESEFTADLGLDPISPNNLQFI